MKKEETASVAGSRMLGNVKVKAYIEERMEQLQSERVEMTSAVLSGIGEGAQTIDFSNA